MAKLTVFWTMTAIKQRNLVFDYWNSRNNSKTYSSKLNMAIKERIDALKHNPEMGKLTTVKSVRGISLGHYSILYKKEESLIYIMAFWDNRQNPHKLYKLLNPTGVS